MTREQEAAFRNIVAEHMGADVALITDSATFYGDLGAESLDVVELVMELEEEFGIEIRDFEMEAAATVGQMLDIIRRKMA